MKPLGRLFRTTWAAALAAVALLSYASVTSVVMQATAASPAASVDAGMDMAAMSMSMPGMVMDHGGADGPSTKAKPDLCAFCSAATHAPILSATLLIPTPGVIAWLVAPVRETVGERGPPSFRATARGPPSPLQTA